MKVIDSINRKQGTKIIMATHDKEIVNSMKKRVITIVNGVVASDEMKGKYRVNEGSQNFIQIYK